MFCTFSLSVRKSVVLIWGRNHCGGSACARITVSVEFLAIWDSSSYTIVSRLAKAFAFCTFSLSVRKSVVLIWGRNHCGGSGCARIIVSVEFLAIWDSSSYRILSRLAKAFVFCTFSLSVRKSVVLIWGRNHCGGSGCARIIVSVEFLAIWDSSSYTILSRLAKAFVFCTFSLSVRKSVVLIWGRNHCGGSGCARIIVSVEFLVIWNSSSHTILSRLAKAFVFCTFSLIVRKSVVLIWGRNHCGGSGCARIIVSVEFLSFWDSSSYTILSRLAKAFVFCTFSLSARKSVVLIWGRNHCGGSACARITVSVEFLAIWDSSSYTILSRLAKAFVFCTFSLSVRKSVVLIWGRNHCGGSGCARIIVSVEFLAIWDSSSYTILSRLAKAFVFCTFSLSVRKSVVLIWGWIHCGGSGCARIIVSVEFLAIWDSSSYTILSRLAKAFVFCTFSLSVRKSVVLIWGRNHCGGSGCARIIVSVEFLAIWDSSSYTILSRLAKAFVFCTFSLIVRKSVVLIWGRNHCGGSGCARLIVSVEFLAIWDSSSYTILSRLAKAFVFCTFSLSARKSVVLIWGRNHCGGSGCARRIVSVEFLAIWDSSSYTILSRLAKAFVFCTFSLSVRKSVVLIWVRNHCGGSGCARINVSVEFLAIWDSSSYTILSRLAKAFVFVLFHWVWENPLSSFEDEITVEDPVVLE